MVPVDRLERRPDFLKVASARRKWAMPGLVLQARRRDEQEGNGSRIRVGFTASRKVGGAVARNRARRRLRAAAREVLSKTAKPGYDFVLIARAGTLGRGYSDLVADLNVALSKLGATRQTTACEDA
jgi:ribonuclease P protein component